MKREFLMLAHDFNPKKHSPCNCYLSEKLDGVRAFWDGGLSQGIPCEDVPWANVSKHNRYKEKPIATGLWTRYAQPIMAPKHWLDHLPKIPLDGELTLGRQTFQQTISIVRSMSGRDSEWNEIRYAIFDSPPFPVIFGGGLINNANMKRLILTQECNDFILHHESKIHDHYVSSESFSRVQHWLKSFMREEPDDFVHLHPQELTPCTRGEANDILATRLRQVENGGGEGVMIRVPHSVWVPERSHNLLKVKTSKDCEATIIGYTWGEKTDVERSVSGEETDRLIGLMGSAVCKLDDGKIFNLSSGFSLQERVMNDPREGISNPGMPVSADFWAAAFPRGTRITIKYREKTDDGLLKEARYVRTRKD